jgi:hypothetical protein
MTIRTRKQVASQQLMTFTLTDEQLGVFTLLAAHVRLGRKTAHCAAVFEFLTEIENRFGNDFIQDVCDKTGFEIEVLSDPANFRRLSSRNDHIEFLV